ncbi:MAG: peptide-methionine (S)-S-oxide reductase MsrA [Chitinophagaceae bacterium]
MYNIKTNENIAHVATLGGGCFWCFEAVFDEVNGVDRVVSGYSGGAKEAPTYREVCNGTTGHAECVQVTFNPSVLSFDDLLRIFFIMHNPTTLNRQGADTGSQYRSVIFYHNEEQLHSANNIITELQPNFDKPIVTEVSLFTTFFKAEEHHQQYYKRDPEKAYCQSVINPKLSKLRQHFNESRKSGTTAIQL